MLTPDANPIKVLADWLADARIAGSKEPEAMCLATVDQNGSPSARMVLLRGLSDQGLEFYTNYESRKGAAMRARPEVAATFWWPETQRQARIEGRVERLPPRDSDAYFATRHQQSQISAIASPQSRVIPDREWLEQRVESVREASTGINPRPQHWGGYRIVPGYFEFWIGREYRLHYRRVFERSDTGWRASFLAP